MKIQNDLIIRQRLQLPQVEAELSLAEQRIYIFHSSK
jgi:hypothetical protein